MVEDAGGGEGACRVCVTHRCQYAPKQSQKIPQIKTANTLTLVLPDVGPRGRITLTNLVTRLRALDPDARPFGAPQWTA